MLLMGHPFQNLPLLLRMGAGYMARFGAPGAQLIGEVKLGYIPRSWLIATAGVNSRFSLREDGQRLLISADAESGLLTGIPISANGDWSVAEMGLIFRLKEDLELNLKGESTLIGRNAPAYRGINGGFVFFF